MEHEKLSYTESQIKELVKWFDGRTYPKDLWVDSCTHLIDTQDTINKVIRLIEENNHSINLLGYVFLLDKIKNKLSSIEEK